jgi:flagellar biosynthesis protein FlhA
LHTLSTAYAIEGRLIPLVTPPSLRVGVRRLIEPVLPSLPVISLAELPPSIALNSVATWDLTPGTSIGGGVGYPSTTGVAYAA